MKKVYTNPEISFTSFEAASGVMTNVTSAAQPLASIATKTKISTINFS